MRSQISKFIGRKDLHRIRIEEDEKLSVSHFKKYFVDHMSK